MNTPPELRDAILRIQKSKQDYISLRDKMNEVLYELFSLTPQGKNKQTGNYVIKLPNPKDIKLPNPEDFYAEVQVSACQIAENLRVALDYMVFQLSAKNNPSLDEKSTQFVIADNKKKFKNDAKRWLKYLTGEEKKFIEQIQYYHGKPYLRLLRDVTNLCKHRRLPEVRTESIERKIDIYFDKLQNKDHPDYKNAWMFPFDNEMALFVQLPPQPIFVEISKYGAPSSLNLMTKEVERIIKHSYKFF